MYLLPVEAKTKAESKMGGGIVQFLQCKWKQSKLQGPHNIHSFFSLITIKINFLIIQFSTEQHIYHIAQQKPKACGTVSQSYWITQSLDANLQSSWTAGKHRAIPHEKRHYPGK